MLIHPRANAASLVLAAALPGCATVTLPDGFEPPPASSGAPVSGVEIVEVIVDLDARPLQGRSRVGTGFLTFVPLVPYAHQQFSPEFGAFATTLKNGDFPQDVGDVIVSDLRAAQVASWVGMPDDRLPGKDSELPAHRLHLTVEEGVYHRNVTTYGLSFFGALLWFVGLPNSYGSAELVISIDLRDPADHSLGTETFHGKSGATEWIYYPVVPAYSPAMPEAYGQISPQLRRFVFESLSSRP